MDAGFVLGLTVALAVIASAYLARVLEVPEPVFLVAAGLIASYVPGAPAFTLSPKVVFYGFLPPLVYYAGFLTSPRALRANWRPISLNALGLVLVTMAAVAAAVHAVLPSLGWNAAFILGAVVAPTDPVAATAVIGRLGGPRRAGVVLEGESLINDGIALVLYGLAVESAGSGSFSLTHGVLRFAEVVAGGVGWGLVVGWVVAQVRLRLHDASIEITLSLLTPFVAYIPADRASVSGVLATVTTGIYLGSRSTGLFRPGVRLQAYAFWEQLNFLLNSVLFVLLGLQFRSVLAALHGVAGSRLAAEAAVAAATVVVLRLVWHFAAPPVVLRSRRGSQSMGSWRQRLLLGWSGMRGAISLAAALSVPFGLRHGASGPARAVILYLTFVVILATLGLQGITLPWLLRWLHLAGSDADRRREVETRLALADAAIERAEQMRTEEGVPAELVSSVVERFERERRLLEAADPDAAQAEDEPTLREHDAQLARALLRARREELNRRYRQGLLDAEQARRLRHELDLEESMRPG